MRLRGAAITVLAMLLGLGIGLLIGLCLAC